MTKLSENTFISISLLIPIIGFSIWLQTIYSIAETNTERLEELKEKQKYYREVVPIINERLAKIEVKVDYVYEKMKDRKNIFQFSRKEKLNGN